MPIATYRGEADIGALADRLFNGLTAPQRERVERALLRANPGLREIGAMREGALLRVPDFPELRPQTEREGGDADAEVAARISGALQRYGTRLQKRFERDLKETQAQQKTLANARLAALIDSSEAAQDVAAAAAASLRQRENDSSKRLETATKAIETAMADLEKLV